MPVAIFYTDSNVRVIGTGTSIFALLLPTYDARYSFGKLSDGQDGLYISDGSNTISLKPIPVSSVTDQGGTPIGNRAAVDAYLTTFFGASAGISAGGDPAKPVVNTAITPLTDQTPLGANYTIQDSQLLDTAAAAIGTIIAGVDAVAPDATAVLKNTLGNIQSTTLIKSASSLDLIAANAQAILVDTALATISTSSIPSNRSSQITAPNGILRDSTPTDVNVKSNEVLVIADTDVTNSDNATVLYSEPKFNNVSLPSIRLTVGATDHDYETSDFSYAAGRLSRVIDDIAGAPVKSGIKYQDWAFYVNRPSYFDGDIRWQIDRGDFDRLAEPSNPTHEAMLADPSNPFVLADNNEFGNTSRWTDPSGGQAFTELTWNKDHLLGVEFQCRGVATGNRLNPAERRDFCIANGGFVMPMFLLLRMHAGYWTYRWTQNNPAIVAILGNGNLIIPTTDPNQNTAGGTPTTYYMGSSANYQQSYYVTNESIASSSKRAWIWCRRFNTL